MVCVERVQLDLLSMESVRKFADEFHASGKKLHMLINCHGFKPCSSSTQICLSADNFELTMAANHLGQSGIRSFPGWLLSRMVFSRKDVSRVVIFPDETFPRKTS